MYQYYLFVTMKLPYRSRIFLIAMYSGGIRNVPFDQLF